MPSLWQISAALALLHVSVGLFFTISGFRKTFNPVTRAGMVRECVSLGHTEWFALFIAFAEFAGGVAMLFGFLTYIAAFGLYVITAGAFVESTVPDVRKKHPNAGHTEMLAHYLCTAEAQLCIVLLSLAVAGSGWLSIDYILGLY